ncbi:MAG: hypothetical protein CL561_01615 [Alphaproteobacteria bacterium]|nr:hypothetical protein [Alphaproteobacteria bacterium]|tara:strand:- start:908 stop:1234 length:327 start_codon:yes stop_codon:yes gene_type:complete
MLAIKKILILTIFTSMAFNTGQIIKPALADYTGVPHAHNDTPEQSRTTQRRENRKKRKSTSLKETIEKRRQQLEQNTSKPQGKNDSAGNMIYRGNSKPNIGKRLWNHY